MARRLIPGVHAKSDCLLALSAILVSGIGGCIGGKPTSFPAAPLKASVDESARAIDVYDTDGDGTGDYTEVRSSDGRVHWLRFASADGEIAYPPASPDQSPQLLLILDSIPFDLVEEAYDAGHFRLFHPPSRIVSPFPVMTDMCLNEFFHASPSLGMESEFFDGERTTAGWELYDAEANSPWLESVDWYFPYKRHNQVYMSPQRGFAAELARIEDVIADAPNGTLVAYSVGTSALGFRTARLGHAWALAELDRFCRMLVHRMKGRIGITLMSDHGHNLIASRSVRLRSLVRDLGFRAKRDIAREDDVVVLEFGLVNCAALHTRKPTELAEGLTKSEGIELALLRSPDDSVTVYSRNGKANIKQCDRGWRYKCESGDPLQLAGVIADLQQAGDVSEDGCIDDEALFSATVDHVYPDPLDRSWRAFHGMIANAPDVLLSLAEGYHWGSPFLDSVVKVAAAHGNLNRMSSTGFVMTTSGELPAALRMRNLAAELQANGIEIIDERAVAHSAN